jgi:hypothetical protein
MNRSELGFIRGTLIGKAIQLMERARSNVRAYVIFSLRNRDLKAWNRGDLKIVYRPMNSGNWQTCNSAFLVGNRVSQQGRMRLACLTNNFNTVYALVRTDQGK